MSIFDLIGTKHERAVIVILAYVIGLTSGYIGFSTFSNKGINTDSSTTKVAHDIYQSKPFNSTNQSFYSRQGSDSVLLDSEIGTDSYYGEVLGQQNETDEFAVYTNNKLYVQTAEGRMLLSIHESSLNGQISDEFSNQGIHKGELVFKDDKSNQLVFFCETINNENCRHFVFSVETSAIHPISINGESRHLSVNEARSALWQGSNLVMGTLVSSGKPWRLSL